MEGEATVNSDRVMLGMYMYMYSIQFSVVHVHIFCTCMWFHIIHVLYM